MEQPSYLTLFIQNCSFLQSVVFCLHSGENNKQKVRYVGSVIDILYNVMYSLTGFHIFLPLD